MLKHVKTLVLNFLKKLNCLYAIIQSIYEKLRSFIFNKIDESALSQPITHLGSPSNGPLKL